ncbi:MAG: hydrogenase maturation nickel metallochaperone HypA [Nitrolancea sp.]
MTDALNQAIVAANNAGARQIDRLTFRYSPSGHVTPEIVETLFQAMSSGTIAEGAHLVVEPQDQIARCVRCDRDFPMVDPADSCPVCNGPGLPLGDAPELILESIDVDD